MAEKESITIYGASDDLIECEGAISDEWNVYNPAIVTCSDGTVLRVAYAEKDEAFWRIERLQAGSAEYAHVAGTDEDTDYSDKVTLTGDIEWVTCGVAKKRAP